MLGASIRPLLAASSAVLAAAALAATPSLASAHTVRPSQPAHAASVEGSAAIHFLNEQRHANGIPAITTVKQSFASSWCPNEDDSSWTPGSLGRTWSSDTAWSPDANPWDAAPMHEFLMYDPLFRAAGDVNHGGACMGLGDATPMPARPTFYAFLSDAGTGAVPPVETVANEEPFAPQNAVGIAEDTQTGPQPILYALGLPGEQLNPDDAVRAVSWSLHTAAGARVADVKMADETAVDAYGYRGYLAVGGVMVPPPLQPGTTYLGRVRWRGPTGATATQSFSFTTAAG